MSNKEKKSILNITGLMKWFPGGTLVIPMLLTATINTLFPDALNIGGTTTPFFKTGTMYIIGFILFCTGITLNPKTLVELCKKNGSYLLVKIIIMVILAFAVQHLMPELLPFGIPAAALFCILTSTNPGSYLEQVGRYGTELDKTTYPLVHLSTTSAVVVLVWNLVGAAGGDIDWMSLLALFCPFIVGFILGNLDPKFGPMFKGGTAMIIPLLGACFGASMDLQTAAVQGGIPGIAVSIIYVVVIIPIFLLLDRVILKRPGYQGVSWCAVSGACAAIPPMIMAGTPMEAYIPQAVAMVATATIVTNLIMPLVNKRVVAKWGDAHGDRHVTTGQPSSDCTQGAMTEDPRPNAQM